MNFAYRKSLALIFTAMLLGGCAGGVATAIKEQNKDPANSYDGAYVATVKHPGGAQLMGNNWTSHCGARDFSVPLNVSESEVSLRWNDDNTLNGFVDKNGRFRIEQPLGNIAKARGTLMTDNSVTVIFQGVLSDDEMVGQLVYGVGQFNGRGCSYPVSYRTGS